MPWNPSAPNVVGMEWLPHTSDVAVVGPEGSALAVAFTAESSRNLVALGAALQVTTPGDWTMELYTEADYLAAVTDTVQHAPFAPTADSQYSGLWTYPTAGAVPYYQWVVGAPGSGANANFVVALGPAMAMTSGFFQARYAGLAIPAGQRLLGLRLQHDREVHNFTDANNLQWVEFGYADSSAAARPRITSEERISTGTARQTVEYTFRPRNVLTTADHAANLAANWAGGGSGFGWFFISYAGTGMQLNSYHLQLTADYVPERRLAWGTGVQPGSADVSGQLPTGPLGNVFTQLSTRGGATVGIVAGTRYVLLLRGAKYDDRQPFVARVQTLAGGPPITGYASGRVRMSANGLPTQAPPVASVGAPLYTTQAGPPTLPADAMPYPLQGVSPVLGTVVARQKVHVGTAGTYGQLVAPVARPNYDPASPLVFRVTDTAGAGIGGAYVLDTTRWDAIPNAYTLGGRVVKDVRMDLPSPVTLAVGDYWIEASTSDSYPLNLRTPWGVLYLEGLTASYPTPGFEPAGPLAARNSAMTMVLMPPTPTNLAAQQVAVQAGPATPGCSGQWDTTVLTWTATTLGATFLRYEVERQQQPDTGAWERVAHIADESVTTFTDRQAERGERVRYRVRVMRTDGGTSAWATTLAATTAAYCCGIGFVSNDPDQAPLFFPDVDELRSYTNLDAAGLVLRATYAQDYQQAFHPTERRGVQLQAQLLVAYGNPTRGLPEYDALRELARTTSPLAVLDELGTRFWAAVQVPDLTFRPHSLQQVYYASVVATQLTDTAPVMAIAAVPVTPPVAGVFHMGDHPNDLLDRNFFMGF